jgi:hypothetical protein
MAHHKQHNAPVPPGNQPHVGPADATGHPTEGTPDASGKMPMQDHDPQRRLGNFEGRGEHSRQQPGPLNDGDKHSQ